MAHPKRFELLTPRFVVWCSIQLSYGCACRSGRAACVGGSLKGLFGQCNSYSKKIATLIPQSSLAKIASLFGVRPGAVIVQRNRAIRNFDAELGADRGLFHKGDGAAMRQHEFAGDGKAKARATGTR